MSAAGNLEKWSKIGDDRSKEDRIRQARAHIRTNKQRRENALIMDKDNSGKGPQERLVELDYRLGRGQGAAKERNRLNKQIGEEK